MYTHTRTQAHTHTHTRTELGCLLNLTVINLSEWEPAWFEKESRDVMGCCFSFFLSFSLKALFSYQASLYLGGTLYKSP